MPAETMSARLRTSTTSGQQAYILLLLRSTKTSRRLAIVRPLLRPRMVHPRPPSWTHSRLSDTN